MNRIQYLQLRISTVDGDADTGFRLGIPSFAASDMDDRSAFRLLLPGR